MIKFLKTFAVFVGTVIGVGIFGLPFAVSQAGFVAALFYFVLLGGLVIGVHLLWGKIAVGTPGLHRLPGYFGIYLGKKWRLFFSIITIFGLLGSLLAYLIVGGEFLNSLLSPYFGGNNIFYSLLFFALGAYFIFKGIKSISFVELALLPAFFIIILFIFSKSLPLINFQNFKTIDLNSLNLPYGVILFSLWGSVIVPELKEMLEGNWSSLKKVIISGIVFSAVLYFIFTVGVVGVTGAFTSKEALSGLVPFLGEEVMRFGFIFGVISCFTTFLALGLSIKKILWYDFGFSPFLGWLVASFVPLAMFLAGLREFIDVISIVGAFSIGTEGIMIVFLYKAFLKQKYNTSLNPLFYIFPLFFILGVGLEIFLFYRLRLLL